MNYLIYETPVCLKRTMTRELVDYSYMTLILIQCIKAIGKDNINDDDITLLRSKLNHIEKMNALKETTFIQSWIRKIIVQICKE